LDHAGELDSILKKKLGFRIVEQLQSEQNPRVCTSRFYFKATENHDMNCLMK